MNITEESKQMFSNINGNYERIKDWSLTFGAPVFNQNNIPSENRISLIKSLIQEEFKEFSEELNNVDTGANFENISLELGDLLWVVYRAFMELGINPNDYIQKIYNSNMSKACKTIEEAKQTVKAYYDGNHPHKPGVKIKSYFEESNGLFIVKDAETNKILKSINSIKN